jgi:hypothetical protein
LWLRLPVELLLVVVVLVPASLQDRQGAVDAAAVLSVRATAAALTLLLLVLARTRHPIAGELHELTIRPKISDKVAEDCWWAKSRRAAEEGAILI